MNPWALYKITAGVEQLEQGMEGEKYLSSKDIKQPRSRCQRSETPVGAHLQIVAQQIQDFRATLSSLRELAATSYLRGRMDFITALAMANLFKLQRSAEFQAF